MKNSAKFFSKLLIIFCIFMTSCANDSPLDQSIAKTSEQLRSSPADCNARSQLAALYQQKGWMEESNKQLETYQECLKKKAP